MTTLIPEHDALKRAVLDTIVPYNTKSSIADLLDGADEVEDPERPSLLHIKQRDLLFFDEKLTVHVVLQLPTLPEESLKALLARLDVKVDVWALNIPGAPGVSEGAANARDLLYSSLIEKADDPIILVKGDDKDEDGNVLVLILWETSVVLNRPRIRFQNPSINIVASAVLPPEHADDQSATENCLPSFQPLEHNVFEPLKNMKGFEENPPYLAASRLERVLPHVPVEAKSFNVRGIIANPIPIVPAVSARTRFTRLPTPSVAFETVASLDFEVTPFVKLDVVLSEVNINMPTGRVEDLMPVEMPLKCSTKDSVTFLYKLHQIQKLNGPGFPILSQAGNTGALDISLSAKIITSPVCISTINIAWSTNIDFSQALNPSFGPPSQPINRQKRPTSLPFAQQPSASSTPVITTTASTSDLTITISAPRDPVLVNKPFNWTIFVRNAKSTPVKLALIPLPRIPRATSTRDAYTRRHAPKSSTASFHPSERRHTRSREEKDLDVAQAVCDENIVYALQHSGGAEKDAEVISLTAELRIGPLAAGCVHESLIRMVALRSGALKVEALRVVDLTRETDDSMGIIVDVRDLPDVIAVDEEAEEER